MNIEAISDTENIDWHRAWQEGRGTAQPETRLNLGISQWIGSYPAFHHAGVSRTAFQIYGEVLFGSKSLGL